MHVFFRSTGLVGYDLTESNFVTYYHQIARQSTALDLFRDLHKQAECKRAVEQIFQFVARHIPFHRPAIKIKYTNLLQKDYL